MKTLHSAGQLADIGPVCIQLSFATLGVSASDKQPMLVRFRVWGVCLLTCRLWFSRFGLGLLLLRFSGCGCKVQGLGNLLI